VFFQEDYPGTSVRISYFLSGGMKNGSLSASVFFSPTHLWNSSLHGRASDQAQINDNKATELFVAEMKHLLKDVKLTPIHE
jgi:hypothetical protein